MVSSGKRSNHVKEEKEQEKVKAIDEAIKDGNFVMSLPMNKSTIHRRISLEQLELEHNMFTKKSYELTEADVSQVLLAQNL